MVQTMDEDKLADKRFQEILDALNKKDHQALKNLFSPNAVKAAPNIDGYIESLMYLYKGKMISNSGGCYGGSGENDHGAKTYEAQYKYQVTTNVDKYVVLFDDILIDTESPDNVGLKRLEIFKDIYGD
jgi:hypothetical protein